MVDLSEGWEHYDADRYAEAGAIAAEVIAADPEEPSAHHLLARCCLGQGALPAAGAAFDRAIELGDEHPDTLALRGWIDLDLGQVELGYERLVAAAARGSQVAKDGALKALTLRRDGLGRGLWVLKQLERLSDQLWIGVVFAMVIVPLARELLRLRSELASPLLAFVMTVAVGYYLGYLATPLKHLLIGLHPVGRRLLSARATLQGRAVGAAMLLGLVLGVVTAILHTELTGIATVLVLLFAFPLTVALAVREPQHRQALQRGVALLAIVGVALLVLKANTPEPAEGPPILLMALSAVYMGACLFGVPYWAGRLMEREEAGR